MERDYLYSWEAARGPPPPPWSSIREDFFGYIGEIYEYEPYDKSIKRERRGHERYCCRVYCACRRAKHTGEYTKLVRDRPAATIRTVVLL